MRNRKTTPPPKRLREKIADTLDISKEIIIDTSKIVAIGNREITVENYRGIIEYADKCIRLITNPYIIKIEGACLEVKAMTRDFLYITGCISSVAFCSEGR